MNTHYSLTYLMLFGKTDREKVIKEINEWQEILGDTKKEVDKIVEEVKA